MYNINCINDSFKISFIYILWKLTFMIIGEIRWDKALTPLQDDGFNNEISFILL